MCLVFKFALGYYVLEHRISHVVHVETETVCSWIEPSSFRGYHAVIGSQRVCKAGAEDFYQVLVVACENVTLRVYVILGERYLSRQTDLSLISFPNWNWIRLVATCPNY